MLSTEEQIAEIDAHVAGISDMVSRTRLPSWAISLWDETQSNWRRVETQDPDDAMVSKWAGLIDTTFAHLRQAASESSVPAEQASSGADSPAPKYSLLHPITSVENFFSSEYDDASKAVDDAAARHVQAAVAPAVDTSLQKLHVEEQKDLADIDAQRQKAAADIDAQRQKAKKDADDVINQAKNVIPWPMIIGGGGAALVLAALVSRPARVSAPPPPKALAGRRHRRK